MIAIHQQALVHPDHVTSATKTLVEEEQILRKALTENQIRSDQEIHICVNSRRASPSLPHRTDPLSQTRPENRTSWA